MRPDAFDVMAFAGLGLLAGGLTLIDPALALAAVGAILFLLGIFLASRRGG
jgi:hypothetical protein